MRRLCCAVVLAGCATARPPRARPPSDLPPEPVEEGLRPPLAFAPPCSRGYGDRHYGLDLPAATGTPVLASARGEVVRASPHTDYGRVVILRHAPGRYTLYGHLSAIAVLLGEIVDAGAEIGQVGESGRASAPHLHWEVIEAGAPLPIRPEGPIGIPGELGRVDPAAAVDGLDPSCGGAVAITPPAR